jgi:hypothetical protein
MRQFAHFLAMLVPEQVRQNADTMSMELNVNAGTFTQDLFYYRVFILTSEDFHENLGWHAECR